MYDLFIILSLLSFLAARSPTLFAMASTVFNLLSLSHLRQLKEAGIRLRNDVQALEACAEEVERRLSGVEGLRG
jgi:hypothetical protein